MSDTVNRETTNAESKSVGTPQGCGVVRFENLNEAGREPRINPGDGAFVIIACSKCDERIDRIDAVYCANCYQEVTVGDVTEALTQSWEEVSRKEAKDMPGIQLVNGHWYAPKWGADSLQRMVDMLLREREA